MIPSEENVPGKRRQNGRRNQSQSPKAGSAGIAGMYCPPDDGFFVMRFAKTVTWGWTGQMENGFLNNVGTRRGIMDGLGDIQPLVDVLQKFKSHWDEMDEGELRTVAEVLDAFLNDFRLSNWKAEGVGYE